MSFLYDDIKTFHDVNCCVCLSEKPRIFVCLPLIRECVRGADVIDTMRISSAIRA